MRLLAVIKEPGNIARYLTGVGETTEVPRRCQAAARPHWRSQVLRLQVLGDEGDSRGSRSPAGDEAE